ncbi:isoleucine--tRNA ligase [Pseudodesulfovibrio piezophilus]|uniref:Isoleucine--tRNA ligase n=1 Tax=Pseudodesulfovibrio piezophilus (strain DSM 21447 / JCM 15486 / C1TLV30) TaxID=1322246 RepID=M1WJC0_PSEP2|nr:isoleucine--tRNA ligase [Pseudodesulfovibrio piezophilus]CCH47631.1 Isoleucyl-tRNA synthetase [Pseudodesulfovibrio piezophilus C1TLV30]
MSDYKKTLLLPKTQFPMKANLKQREPEMLKFWEDTEAYEKMVAASDSKKEYVLHDGPPYANGHIHMGTALNKVLKDIVIKSRNIQGQQAQYVPGWDCHGLPIEHKVEQELKKKNKELDTLTIRKICRSYAAKWLDTQRKEFKRLGVLGVWETPYMTMNPEYEAATARELGKFMERDGVVRGKKPIYWCCDCRTALAEAEVEYEDHTSPSIYVRFPLADENAQKLGNIDISRLYIAIWTTTPWTIPDNMGVAVHPDFDYAIVKSNNDFYILAEGLLEECSAKFGWESPEIIKTIRGAELEGLQAKHPIYNRPSPIVLADYVTLETGTGCVHTAPGHGREDFETGLKYRLEVYSPMNDRGEFLPEVEFFSGLNVWEANPAVIKKLTDIGNLLASEDISHSYPHCWRCKKPVIFRATTQWFVGMDENSLRDRSLDAIRNKVDWIPGWGEERIYNMVKNRPDWCISRQRNWGVPISALICEDCDETWFDAQWVYDICDKYASHETGCDYWFEAPIEEIVPEGLTCSKCGGTHWKRETDILDVWFDSGTSYAAVVEQRPETRFPADLYLEGSDQHRGWFHSSLLASMGTRDVPPYKTVLTHGYVVDSEGRKMSKSIGNVIAPQEIIDKYGAEILRMWVSASNYQEDIRISDETLNRLVDAYRRIRNTCRYLLSNLNDFDPQKKVAANDLLPLDKYALDMVSRHHAEIQNAYKSFEFHKVYHTLHNLCVVDLSAFYLDIIKDRLYVEEESGLKRRSAQTVLWQILLMLLQDMAPILSFTAEEAFQSMSDAIKGALDQTKTVFALRYSPDSVDLKESELADWEKLTMIRSVVNKAIEPNRKNGVVGKSLDAQVTLYASEDIHRLIYSETLDEQEFFIVSKVIMAHLEDAPTDAYEDEEVPELKVSVEAAPGGKCERCWRITEELGTDPSFPDACPRCSQVLKTVA